MSSDEFKKARDGAAEYCYEYVAFKRGADWAYGWCHHEQTENDLMREDRNMYKEQLEQLTKEAEALAGALNKVQIETIETPEFESFDDYQNSMEFVKQALARWKKFRGEE